MRAAWPTQVAGVAPEDFVFVDEGGVNRAMTRLYARSPRGSRAFGSAPRNWGENVSIIGALTSRGSLEAMVVNGATDGAVFLTYRREVLIPQLWAGAVVVLDNLGAHKVRGVQGTPRSGRRAAALPAALLPGLQPHRDGLEQTEELPAWGSRAHGRGPGRRPSARACAPSAPRTLAAASSTAASSANLNE